MTSQIQQTLNRKKRILSEEQRKHISEATKGKSKSRSRRRPISDETKRRLREASIRRREAAGTVRIGTIIVGVLQQIDCSRKITRARQMLKDNNDNYIGNMVYQKQIANLETGRLATGLPCHKCRTLVKIGSKYASRSGGHIDARIYHLVCARRLNII